MRIMPNELRYTIYEATNETTREIFVGSTTDGIHEVIAQNKIMPPRPIAHWSKADITHYRSVEFNLSASQTKTFVDSRAQAVSKSGWKVIKQPAPK